MENWLALVYPEGPPPNWESETEVPVELKSELASPETASTSSSPTDKALLSEDELSQLGYSEAATQEVRELTS